MKRSFFKLNIGICFVAAVSILTSCQPDDQGSGNGLTNGDLNADFTVEQLNGSANRLRLHGDTKALVHKWNGELGSDQKDMIFALAGDYTVEHTACGIGGECETTTQVINVPTNIPIAVNLAGTAGTFETQADIDAWSIMGGGGADWTFGDGRATLTGTGAWAQKVLYKAFEVEGGHDYLIDMHVSSTAGMDQTFFEVYAGYNAPVAGTDYSEGGKILQINTWDGCGTAPFAGQFTSETCGNTLRGVKHFNTSGTVYLVIRGGSGAPPFSISIDDVIFGKID